MNRIVVGFDGSEGAENALNKAMMILDEDGELIILAIVPVPSDKNLLDQKSYDVLKLRAHTIINNVVSDIVTVETKDLITVDVRISYRVNFEGDNANWFKVSDYVKLLTQHMRSLIRNVVKKKTVQDFNDNATDIIRDVILGESKEGKRTGRLFRCINLAKTMAPKES